jgi:hypothetical protein
VSIFNPPKSTVPIAAAAAATTVVVAAEAGRIPVVYGYGLVLTAAGTYRWETTDGTDLSGDVKCVDTGGIAMIGNEDCPILIGKVGQGLQLVLVGAGAAAAGHLTLGKVS